MRLALQINPRLAKFAARIIAVSSDAETRIALVEVRLFDYLHFCHRFLMSVSSSSQSVVEELNNREPDKLVAPIAALAQVARFAPAAFEHKSDVITTFLLKKVLMVPVPPDPVRLLLKTSPSSSSYIPMNEGRNGCR